MLSVELGFRSIVKREVMVGKEVGVEVDVDVRVVTTRSLWPLEVTMLLLMVGKPIWEVVVLVCDSEGKSVRGRVVIAVGTPGKVMTRWGFWQSLSEAPEFLQ